MCNFHLQSERSITSSPRLPTACHVTTPHSSPLLSTSHSSAFCPLWLFSFRFPFPVSLSSKTPTSLSRRKSSLSFILLSWTKCHSSPGPASFNIEATFSSQQNQGRWVNGRKNRRNSQIWKETHLSWFSAATMRTWLQDLIWIPKSTDVQVP